jgi:tellurite resistance protein
MASELNEPLVARIAEKLGEPPRYAPKGGVASVAGAPRSGHSVLLASAAQFGRRPQNEEHTQPSGFDPRGAALFEAIVESAYLVATADGVFDEKEQRVFQHIVLTVCAGALTEQQVEALVFALRERMHIHGRASRMLAVTQAVSWSGHSREVLRIAALMAEASGGVSAEERAVLEELTRGFVIPPRVLDETLEEVRALRERASF